MTAHSVGSVGLARQDNSSDTNLFAVTGEIIIQAMDADDALQKVYQHILKGQKYKWLGTTMIPRRLEDSDA